MTKLKLCLIASVMLEFGSLQCVPLSRAQSVISNVNSGPAFEIATIKAHDSESIMHTVKIGFEQERFSATNCTLELLLQVAYSVDAQQITGIPKWMRNASYDVEAKMDADTFEKLRSLGDEQRDATQRIMLQTLLADRFNLRIDRETKELPIYSLVVSKNGPKLQKPKLGDTYINGDQWPEGTPMGPHVVSYSFIAGQVHMKGQAASMKDLTNRLTQKFAENLGRKIVDNTGLTGDYDFQLDFKIQWPPAESGALSNNSMGKQNLDGGIAPENSDSSLFTALEEQLGLKLQPTKGPVELIVIDHVDKPSEN